MTEELDVLALPVVGALGREVTARGGVVFRRLPDWTRPQLVDPQLQLVVQMPAGVRIELVTDAAWLELDVHVTCVEIAITDTLRPPGVSGDSVS